MTSSNDLPRWSPVAILHLAFDGLGATEAHSEGAVDNVGSNAVSERLGYERNGVAWATHQGTPVLGQRWRLDRETWQARRRDDITMSGVAECRHALGIDPAVDAWLGAQSHS